MDAATLREGRLRIEAPSGFTGSKFDDERSHGLSHAMRAVNFVLEKKGVVWFIEIKGSCPSKRT